MNRWYSIIILCLYIVLQKNSSSLGLFTISIESIDITEAY